MHRVLLIGLGGILGSSLVFAEEAGDLPASEPAPAPHVLRFFNGDRLHGRLLGAAAATGLRWSHPTARTVIEFAAGDVAVVRLAPPGPARRSTAAARVVLTNGDELRGTVVALDGETLTLETGYAGTLALRRVMVRSVQPNLGAAAPVYQGPNAADDWRLQGGNRVWAFRNGAFYGNGNGMIGRDVRLPDRARIEFDAAWQVPTHFQVGFYTDTLEMMNGNCYLLSFSGNAAQLHRSNRNRGGEIVGNPATLENWMRRSRARIGLLVDKPKQTITLLVDDRVVKQWTDPNEFAGHGTGLVFGLYGPGVLRLSNIVVSEWSGEVDPTLPEAAPAEDAIRFANNDRVSGRLKGIAKRQVTFVTPFATLTVPLERVIEFHLSAAAAERARRRAEDVRAVFHDGGSVTLALDKLDEQTLTGHSENFGRASFARAAFRELRFNLYDERGVTMVAETESWETE